MSATGQDPETQVWLVRHGETEWSRDGRHTSTTDLPLTPEGEAVARSLRDRLAEVSFDLVLTSPMQRARVTADLVGFDDAEVDDDLVEWRYGDYEGRTNAEIREEVPGWTIWTHLAPGGETPDQVTERLDRVVERRRATSPSAALVFGHGHALRALTARWLGLPVTDGRLFRLDTATLSRLGYERENPRHPGLELLTAPCDAALTAGGQASRRWTHVPGRGVPPLPRRRGDRTPTVARAAPCTATCPGTLWRPDDPAAMSYDVFVDHLGTADGFPTYLPWPMSPGWSVTDFAVAAGDRPWATATCVSGTSELDGPVDVFVVAEEPGTGLGVAVRGHRPQRPRS